MDVILLERVGKLGKMGDTVRVRDGYARNYLLPEGKALRASEGNKARFEREREQLEKRNLELKTDAQSIADQLEGKYFTIIRQAGETGQLYGSVSTRDIAEVVAAEGYKVSRQNIVLHVPIKTIGLHTVPVSLHSEVEVSITINIARSPQEAERQQRGEELNVREEDPVFETFNPEDGVEDAE